MSVEQSSETRLAEIEARLQETTVGPWGVGTWMGERFVTRQDGTALWNDQGAMDHVEDARFIAHAREDVPWLIARVRELESAASLRAGDRSGERERFAALGWDIGSIEEACEEMERLSGLARGNFLAGMSAGDRSGEDGTLDVRNSDSERLEALRGGAGMLEGLADSAEAASWVASDARVYAARLRVMADEGAAVRLTADDLAVLRYPLKDGNPARHREILARLGWQESSAALSSREEPHPDSARLDKLERLIAPNPEQGHGADVMLYGGPRNLAIGYGAWHNKLGDQRPSQYAEGADLRAAIDAISTPSTPEPSDG